MQPRVTIGIPVYKRLRTLQYALESVVAQDYPNIELVVSDNGQNGAALEALVRQHYPRPFTLHHHPWTVSAPSNFNTLVGLATGEYFVLLCDDDEISPGFVSELAGLLEANPRAALAIPRHEKMDGNRQVFSQSAPNRPPVMEGGTSYRSGVRASTTSSRARSPRWRGPRRSGAAVGIPSSLSPCTSTTPCG